MKISIDQELLYNVNESLKYNQSKFKTIEELTEYLLKQYVLFHDNGDDLCELIESYNDTHKEINNLPIENHFDTTYDVEDDIEDDDYD